MLPHTQDQAKALQDALADMADMVGVFVAMRYWHPLTAETVRKVKDFGPDKVILLPLYPQYSVTTSGSSIGEWTREAARQGLTVETVSVCCYPTDPGFVQAQAALVAETLDTLETERDAHPPPRVLFSAHGLPKKVIASGDPYQWQVEQTAAAVVERLDRPGLDWRVSYQSRVGPLEWIGPATDDEIKAAGAENRPLVVVPIAFVSEHSETLVELDIEYGALAKQSGVPLYRRVSTVLTAPSFIEGLSRLVRHAATSGATPVSGAGGRLCPKQCERCPNSTVTTGAQTQPAPPRKAIGRNQAEIFIVLDYGSEIYNWVKVLHIISVITWMAGLFYLPRLFVYHAQEPAGSATSETFKVMERRLLKGIMNPSIVVVFATGLMMFPTWMSDGWIHAKLLLVLLMAGMHGAYAKWRKDFLNDANRRDHRFYRWMNEVPTVLLLFIIPLVIFKWF